MDAAGVLIDGGARMPFCLCLSLPLTVRRECVCMNGHQTWRPVRATEGAVCRSRLGARGSLSSIHRACLDVSHSPFVASVPLPSPPSHDTQTPLFPAQPSGSQITSRVL